MNLNYLLDENLPNLYKTQLSRKNNELVVWKIGDPQTPSIGTLDPDILMWCEEYNFILVTNNRTSMPTHLSEHLQKGRHISGIFILNKKLTIGQIIDELIFLAEVSFPNEYQNQIIHLPHSFTLF